MSVNETDDLTELRHWLVCLVVGSIALGLLVILPYLWWLNVTQIDQQKAILELKDFFELRNQAIKSVTTSIQILATVFGGIAILFNVYYGAKRAKALEKNAIAATQNAIAATKNSEVAERMPKTLLQSRLNRHPWIAQLLYRTIWKDSHIRCNQCSRQQRSALT